MADDFVSHYIANPVAVLKCIEIIETGMNEEEKKIREAYYSNHARNAMEDMNIDYRSSLPEETKEKARLYIERSKRDKYGNLTREDDIDSSFLLATFAHAMSIRTIISEISGPKFRKLFAEFDDISESKLKRFTGIMYGEFTRMSPKTNKESKTKKPAYGGVLRLDMHEKVGEENLKFRNWASALSNFVLQRDENGKICGFNAEYAIERFDKKLVYELKGGLHIPKEKKDLFLLFLPSRNYLKPIVREESSKKTKKKDSEEIER